MKKLITSIQNPLIKDIILLQEKSRHRKKSKLFTIEGQREISLAVKGGYSIKTLLYCKNIIDIDNYLEQFDTSITDDIIEISTEIYEKLAYRKSSEGLIAVTQIKTNSIDELRLDKNPLIIVIEAPEKPGNLGALLRTADAANVDAVIIANPKTDLYNPNIVRSSVGCLFTNTIATGTSQETIQYLKSKNINIFSAVLSEQSENYLAQNFTQPTALVVGTEATGLSEIWVDQSTKNIIIPMEGEIDSLNVSVSAAILIFEAKRQRNKTV